MELRSNGATSGAVQAADRADGGVVRAPVSTMTQQKVTVATA